jgi:hypothetical protein
VHAENASTQSLSAIFNQKTTPQLLITAQNVVVGFKFVKEVNALTFVDKKKTKRW